MYYSNTFNSNFCSNFKGIKSLTYDVKIEVDGKDAIQMLDSYVRNKTQLVIVDAKNEADFIFTLNMKIDGQKRIGLLKLTDAKKETEVWTSVWTKGSSLNQYYGYSGTRHSIGKIIKEQFLETFPTIEKKD